MKEEHLAEGRLYPPLEDIKEVSLQIAIKVSDECYRAGHATNLPEPEDKAGTK